MDNKELCEIIECLPRGRTVFHYFKDRFALLLLRHLIGAGTSVADLKASRYAPLLERRPVKALLAACGDGWIDPRLVDLVWADDAQAFVLTLSHWDGRRSRWSQTSRRGLNLVLQLNFSSMHDRRYRRQVQPCHSAMLNGYGHPVMREGRRELFRETLAWARIDADLGYGEALVEEVQSDWVRQAAALLHHARACLSEGRGRVGWYGVQGEARAVVDYVEYVLAPYQAIWAEAMLAVAIDFIHRELGIDTIYYHEFETGCRLKNIQGRRPPRSLYTTLPRRFCFQATERAPEFLLADKTFRRKYRKVATPAWQRLKLREVRCARTA